MIRSDDVIYAKGEMLYMIYIYVSCHNISHIYIAQPTFHVVPCAVLAVQNLLLHHLIHNLKVELCLRGG